MAKCMSNIYVKNNGTFKEHVWRTASVTWPDFLSHVLVTCHLCYWRGNTWQPEDRVPQKNTCRVGLHVSWTGMLIHSVTCMIVYEPLVTRSGDATSMSFYYIGHCTSVMCFTQTCTFTRAVPAFIFWFLMSKILQRFNTFSTYNIKYVVWLLSGYNLISPWHMTYCLYEYICLYIK